MPARRRFPTVDEVTEMFTAIQRLRTNGTIPNGFGVEVGADSVKLLPPANQGGESVGDYINRPAHGAKTGEVR